MTTTARQNNIILNQDWTRIYQTFKNADFKSYDFENLRRVILTYLRENYPEDFNDYIESSEYMALIDAVAFLGQSLAFRIDLASRENFIELADRRESVLRLARMLSYNAKRNIPATGELKFTSVTTTEDLRDSNGKSLTNQIVTWNDPTNVDWLEQFTLIINATMADNTEFGRSEGTGIVQGIPTEQYRFRTINSDIPVFTFSKSVASRGMTFEVVSTAFDDRGEIKEEPPIPGNQLGFIFKNDGRGSGSQNTGFFLMFKQGSLELADFSIDVPTPNERVAVDSQNINNKDVWLFKLDSQGRQLEEWTSVPNIVGNNITFNSISQNIRNVYAVSTKEADRIDLVFADGVYGNLPQGTFRVYYRVSNGLTYVVSPNEMRGINISVPYVNKQGTQHTLKISLALQYTVTTASAAESTDSVRQNAPAQYYTQNRMITAEDYNLAPLTSSQDIIKVKAINRTSSGISRNFDLIDASGKYSSINVFANDGYIYKEEQEKLLSFKFKNRFDVINFIKRNLEPQFVNPDIYNFYVTKFDRILFTDVDTVWQNVTSNINLSTGFFRNNVDQSLLRVGTFATNSLKYASPEALIKFEPMPNMAFKRGQMVPIDANDSEQTDRLWVKIVRVFGDGTNAGRGALPSGEGPIIFNSIVPTGAIAKRIVPKFIIDLPDDIEREIVNQTLQNVNFGLRYDFVESKWKIIVNSNLNLNDQFSLGKTGDATSNNLDASWIVAFVKEADRYIVRVRSLSYVFGSVKQNRFYFDPNEKSYNDRTGRVVKDSTIVLGINTDSTGSALLKSDIGFEITDTIKFVDGFESTSEIKIAFSDSDSDGVIDNPEAFEQIVGEDQELNFLFFKEIISEAGDKIFELQDNFEDEIIIRQRESQINVNEFEDGQLIYFFDASEDRVKRVNRTTNTLDLESSYKANYGRNLLKFQYLHNASVDRRIDPSASNIIDIYLLIRSYDEAYRNFLIGVTTRPEEPTSDQLRLNYGSALAPIKSISDEIIYHPVRYNILFGSQADEKLQAQFKVVKNPSVAVSDNDLKVNIINAINEFFDVNNWDFGDKFYISELTTYILNTNAPRISNLIIVPKQPTQAFGSLFEIQSRSDEIFISGATVDDIEIVSSISALNLNDRNGQVITTTTSLGRDEQVASQSPSTRSSVSPRSSVPPPRVGGISAPPTYVPPPRSTGGGSTGGGSTGGGGVRY